jgi:hypothetical protein
MQSFLCKLSRKDRGQGMVEFALVLPLLMTLMVGIIEVGRLFFTYSSVAVASREAARYASASGTSINNVPYYLDCMGIRSAAKRVGFFAGISDDNIYITYDDGPGSSYYLAACSPANPPPSECYAGNYPASPENGDVTYGARIRVCIVSDYEPFMNLIAVPSFTLQSETSRTILKDVSIEGDPPVGSPPIPIIISPSHGAVFLPGDTVTFSGSATDAEDGDLSNNLEWYSDLDGSLGTGASISVSDLSPGTHVITAQVIDSDGNRRAANIAIVVSDEGPPIVTILSPTGSPLIFEEGESIGFAASADDNEGDLSANLAWIDEDNAPIGYGSSFSKSDLSAGIHTITAFVYDSDANRGEDVIVVEIIPNTPPIVTIVTPGDEASFEEGELITFSGTAVDTKDGDLSADLIWKSSIDGPIGSGASFSITDLSIGIHTITAEAADSRQLVGSDLIVISITPNIPPVVTIYSPMPDRTYRLNSVLSFSGSAVDGKDGDLSADIIWTSNIDGEIGYGASFPTSSLREGVHTITARVTDSGGVEGEASITIRIVDDSPPTVTITTPEDGAVYSTGTSIDFIGSAIDRRDGDLSPSLTWYSSLDGWIGQGPSFSTANLQSGSHTITAESTDSYGLVGSASITINVHNPPVVTILSPENEAEFKFDDTIVFAGTAIDPEDGDLSSHLIWSIGDQTLGTGASISKSGLNASQYVITATATDSDGVTGSASIIIKVLPNPCMIEKIGYTVDKNAKKIIWNLRNNNTQTSYTLTRLTIPWDQTSCNKQSLQSVTLGGQLLWSGNDTTAGSRFGLDAASEFIWTITYPQHSFEKATIPYFYTDEDLVFVFGDKICCIEELTIAVFQNDLTGDSCDVSVSFIK